MGPHPSSIIDNDASICSAVQAPESPVVSMLPVSMPTLPAEAPQPAMEATSASHPASSSQQVCSVMEFLWLDGRPQYCKIDDHPSQARLGVQRRKNALESYPNTLETWFAGCAAGGAEPAARL